MVNNYNILYHYYILSSLTGSISILL